MVSGDGSRGVCGVLFVDSNVGGSSWWRVGLEPTHTLDVETLSLATAGLTRCTLSLKCIHGPVKWFISETPAGGYMKEHQ